MAFTSLPRSSRYWFRFALGGALLATFGAVAGCRQNNAQAPIISSTGPDPANANLADPNASGSNASSERVLGSSAAKGARVLGSSAAYQPQQSAESYSGSYAGGQQAPAPIVRGSNSQANESLQYNTQPPVPQNAGTPAAYPQDPNAAPDASYDPNYTDAQENAGYEALEQADQAPPPLPQYDQPEAPADNYLWTPGYWGYTTGYYWVPGAWVAPPFYGALWTPPWWGFYGNRYLFHRGYWGPHVGYYGGIDYGYGYVGSGYYGGFWQGRSFYYNRSVTRVNVNVVHNVYERPVVVNNITYRGDIVNRTAFNGPNGVRVQPRPYELAAMREAHYAPVAAQVQMRQAAASNRGQFFADNHGRPAQAFAQRPLSTPAAIASAPPLARNQPGFNRGGNPGFNGAGRGPGQLGFPQNGVNANGSQINGSQPNGVPQNNQQNRALEEERQRGQAAQSRFGQQPSAAGTSPRTDLQVQQPDGRRGFEQGQREAAQGQREAAQGQRDQDLQRQRNAATQQGRDQQLQAQRDAAVQQQRDAAAQQQRNQQFQQQRNQQFQQQRDAASQQGRDAATQQQRNQQFQQQRDAAAQQGRDAAAQQQRTQQQQQQMEQQRNAMRRNPEVQQRMQTPGAVPQQIQARPPAPAPQPHVETPHPQAGPHPGRP